MLQAAAFLALFYKRMSSGNLHDDRQIDSLEAAAIQSEGASAVEEILADMSKDRMTAARKTIALASSSDANVVPLMTAARRLVFSKGNDSHDYKFSSAALEDYYHATPAWRARLLATSMFNLKGSGDRDTNLMKSARAALAKT
jgi:hypothetical protein